MKPKLILQIIVWAASIIGAYLLGAAIRSTSPVADAALPPELLANLKGLSSFPTNHWLSTPRCRHFGRFIVLRPADTNDASLAIAPLDSPHFPIVWIEDSAKSGRPEDLTFCDAKANTITVMDVNHDGVFENLGMVTTNGVYADKGLTGTWKFRTLDYLDRYKQ